LIVQLIVSAATRDNLVDAAMRLFYEQGYANTGVATILREAGVNSGSLYHFVPGKEALLTAVLQKYRQVLQPIVLGPIEQQTDDPIERVFTLLVWYRAGLERTGCKMGCPIGNLALEISDHHPDLRPLIHANFDGWTDGVKKWLDDAGDRLPRDVDRKELAQMVLNTMEGGIMQARSRGELAPFDAAVRQLRHYFDLLLRRAREEDEQRVGPGRKRSRDRAGRRRGNERRSLR
jgi:AcrR family transcriptional regulator